MTPTTPTPSRNELRQQLMAHIEETYREAGTNPGGALVMKYLERLKQLHYQNSFRALLQEITKDAKASKGNNE